MFLKMLLQLFAEGAGAESGTTSEAGTEATSTETAQAAEGSNPDAEFENLIAEKYKDQYEKKLKSAMDRRFKKADAAEKYNASVKPLIDELGAKYGITDGNVDSILAKFKADNSNYEAEAIEKGIPVETVRQMRELESQNRMLTQARQEAYEEQQRRESFNRFMAEAEEVKQRYPSFNVETELNNPAFMRLINSGVGVQNAYVSIHADEILSQTIPYAINTATQKVANAVKANGKRVLEGGAGSSAPASVSDTHKAVSEMSSEERAALWQRALNGEKIRL